MSALLRWVSLRHLARAWPRSLLTTLGVALGVAVFTGVRLANHSALASFSRTVDAVAGRANLEIAGDGEGVDERLLLAALATPGVEAAAPVIQTWARARRGGPAPRSGDAARRYPESLLVLGVDVFSEGSFQRTRPGPPDRERALAMALLSSPRAAAAPESYARRAGLRAGDTVTVLASGRPVPLVVRALVPAPELDQAFAGGVLLVDVATAQDVFGREGRLDRVDLRVDPARRDAVAAALARRLPPGVHVEPPATRTRQVESLVHAFALNLSALSFIALFVASFLVFHAVAMAVVRRRGEIGVLRAVGVTRRQAALLLVGEGLAYGLAGGVLGVVAGSALARVALDAVAGTLADLYQVQESARVHADPAVVPLGLALGLATAALSALLPALEAARTPPSFTIRQGAWLEAQRPPGRALAGLGALALVLAGVFAVAAVRLDRPFGGFASAFLVLAGLSLLAPASARALARAADATLGRWGGIVARLGARDLRESAARVGAVLGAVLVAVGMMVALGIMVGSFRRTVEVWVGQTLRGDLYVEPVGHRIASASTDLPDMLVERIRRLPGVAAVDTYRGTRVRFGGRAAFVAGVDLGVEARHGRLLLVRGDSRATLESARAGGGALVTESFARHHRVAAGDTITLDTPAGRARLPVFGVFYDYTTDAGAILLDRSLFERLWRTRRTESLAIYLDPGARPEAVRARVLAAAGDRVLSALPNRVLRKRVLEVFDRTFRITWVLQAIAVLAAMLGVAVALTARILDRAREIGVLRSAGALRGQVRAIVLVESGLIGLGGGLLGCVAGTALALVLVHVILRGYFGWTVRLVLDPWILARAVGLVTAAALVSAIGPARLAAGRVIREAMRME